MAQVIGPPAPAVGVSGAGTRERVIAGLAIVTLLAAGVAFRFMRLSSVPGVSGDEGWWGIQALAWLSNQPYEAQTTSGNPIDLLFLIPVALAQHLGSPSFFMLRLVPAVVNVLALPVSFFFVRRLYGGTTAWIHTVGLAVLPTAIAHSRISQDPSQSIFWAGIVVYLSLLAVHDAARGWIFSGLSVAALPIALWTHPTNIFIAPFVVVALVATLGRALSTSPRRRAAVAVAGLLLVCGVIGPVAFFAAPRSWSEALDRPWLQVGASRMMDGGQWFEFAANVGRFFNGVTVYHYFAGARPLTVPYDAAFALIGVVVLGGLTMAWRTGSNRADTALIVAGAGMWFTFFLFPGPQALRPHAERWGLCLVVPSLLAAARGWTAWIDWRPAARHPALAGATLVGALMVSSFYVNYFAEFAATGGRSHLTYVTAGVEPKQQALERILTAGGDSPRITIVTRQWWLYWPIRYLATAHPRVTVVMHTSDRPLDLERTVQEARLFIVEFTDTPELPWALEQIEAHGLRAAAIDVHDAGGRALLTILAVARAR
jgi:hypothetical protein